MTEAKISDLQALVTDAVVDLLRGRAVHSEESAPATVRIPLQVASQDDLTALVRWLRKLCASDALRKQFVRGDIGLDIQWVAPAKAVAAAGAAPAVPAAPAAVSACEDAVITEAALRRLGLRNQTLHLRKGAVVTPSARDYARTAGIRMQKGDKP